MNKREKKAFKKYQKDLNNYQARGKEEQKKAQIAFNKKWKSGAFTNRQSQVNRNVENGSGDNAFNDDGYKPYYGEDDMIDVETEKKKREERERKRFWKDNSKILRESFLKSFQLFGQPPEHLTSFGNSLTKLPACNCAMESHRITVYMLFGQVEAEIDYCIVHRPLLQALILLQVLPSAKSSPKSAIHFSVFEFATFAKLDGFMSNHAIIKVLNNHDMQKHDFKTNDPPKGYSPEFREDVFAPSAEEKELWGSEAECMVDFDNDFKADQPQKKSARFDENGVSAVSCARHGCVERIYDITGGEGHKYAIACVNHVVDHMPAHQKKILVIQPTFFCKREVPKLVQLDPIYAVTAFHAYAHSIHCQMSFNPKYLNVGKTDGESCERFWSYTSRFVGMTRMMSKANRKLLLLEVIENYTAEKMLELRK
ncbi:hypothetical protein [Parasitella parasitica]|uniref:Uncharacterized protein n=1 Tax=Parasitella parasitica TaxID=35722 RepID=A0A0B7N177_9FUNG|nr:hypothetical protein [Parasitella parasitica]